MVQGRRVAWFGWIGVLACLAFAGEARAAHAVVDTQSELNAAVQRLARTGGVIVLRPGRYRRVHVGARSSRRLTIFATGASTRSLLLLGTRNVRIVGLTVSSASPPRSQVEVVGSRSVVLDRVGIFGTAGSRVRVRLLESVQVEIRGGRFRRCGEEDACILLGRSRGVRILSNTFGNCHNCDCVRGRLGGAGLVVRDNDFGNVVRAHCPPGAICNHQDHLQVQEGTDIVIERNRFGVYDHGAAQIYLSGPLDRVLVANNAFRATDPAMPGLVAAVGITVGNRREKIHPPFHVVIAHNTILSGALHTGRGSESSIALTPTYSRYASTLRPIVVNNVLAVLKTPEWVCEPARSSRYNIVREGQACSATDVLTDPLLDPVWGVPGPDSPTIDRGQPGWVVTDLNRVRRDALPDIGAYEFIGT